MLARARTLPAGPGVVAGPAPHTWRVIGVFLVASSCAAFWTGVIAAIGYIINSMPSPLTLATIAASILAFLLVVCAPLMLADRNRS